MTAIVAFASFLLDTRSAPTRHEKIEPLTPEEVPLFLAAARASMPSETKKAQVIRNGKVELQVITLPIVEAR